MSSSECESAGGRGIAGGCGTAGGYGATGGCGGAGGQESDGERRSRRRSVYRALTGTLCARCFLTWVLYVAGLVATLLIGKVVCSTRIWYGDEPLYLLLKVIDRQPFVWLILLAGAGLLVIVFIYWLRTLRYLDRIGAAAERLATDRAAPVELPGTLVGIQERLDAARRVALAAEAQAQMEAQRKNDLLVYLAHDLKTPLTSVIGYLRLLHDERDISLEVRERYEGIALERAERLEDLINEFFETARLNLSEAALAFTDVNLARMVEQELFEYLPAMEPKGLTYALDAPADVTVSCDVGKIARVLDNLLRNAVNYSHPNTQISVALAEEERGGVPGACLRVTNHGDTISPAQLERLFEQFFRLSSSRDADTGGAGLGLAIARGLVQAHGGTIRAESGAGTVTFIVWLPKQPAVR